MPNVIVNTSPLQYLYQVNLLELLPKLYQKVIIPQAVLDEITEGIKLGVSLPDISSQKWIQLSQPQSNLILPLVTELGAGERAVLALGIELENTLVVLDDGLARRYGKLLQLQITGTLGILLRAKQKKYISKVAPILEQLKSLNFRLSSQTQHYVLSLAKE